MSNLSRKNWRNMHETGIDNPVAFLCVNMNFYGSYLAQAVFVNLNKNKSMTS